MGHSLGAIQGADLHVYDLRTSGELLGRFEDVVDYDLHPGVLVTSQRDGLIRRYEEVERHWQLVAVLTAPPVVAAESQVPSRLLLSPSGASLVVESAPIPTGPRTWPVARAFVLDALTGEVRHAVDLHKTLVRAGFGRLPTGREIVFLSAPGYMDVQLVDCGSGTVLRAMSSRVNGFCHTRYELSPDGRRLYCSGCWWACPDEQRLYDMEPWLDAEGVNEPQPEPPRSRNEPLIADAPPLPVLFERGEVLYGELTHPIAPSRTRDGTFTCVSTIHLGILHKYTTAEMRFDLEPAPSDPEILDRLLALPLDGRALVVRRIDPTDGSERGWAVAYVPTGLQQHQNIHILPDHRVLLVNERVWLMNGQTGEIEDKGASSAPTRWFATAATADAGIVVISSPEGD